MHPEEFTKLCPQCKCEVVRPYSVDHAYYDPDTGAILPLADWVCLSCRPNKRGQGKSCMWLSSDLAAPNDYQI